MSHNNDYGFFYNIRQTVYKWWCVVYKPAYKLFHHGYWPAEKEPYYQADLAKQEDTSTVSQPTESTDATNTSSLNAQDLANQILSSKQGNVDAMVANTTPLKQETSGADKTTSEEPEIDLSKVDADALARANEIMARLAAEAAADEAKKQAEIDAAKAKAREDEMLASILKSTKVDISAFIEEGKAQRQDNG